MLEIENNKLKNERDFHNQQHILLRNEIFELAKTEYDVDVLREEIFYLREKEKLKEEKLQAYEEQFQEMALLFQEGGELQNAPSAPGSKQQKSTEKDRRYFTDKIIELENELMKEKHENDRLRGEIHTLEKVQKYVNNAQNDDIHRLKKSGIDSLENEEYQHRYEETMKELIKLRAELDRVKGQLQKEELEADENEDAAVAIYTHEKKLNEQLREAKDREIRLMAENRRLKELMEEKDGAGNFLQTAAKQEVTALKKQLEDLRREQEIQNQKYEQRERDLAFKDRMFNLNGQIDFEQAIKDREYLKNLEEENKQLINQITILAKENADIHGYYTEQFKSIASSQVSGIGVPNNQQNLGNKVIDDQLIKKDEVIMQLKQQVFRWLI